MNFWYTFHINDHLALTSGLKLKSLFFTTIYKCLSLFRNCRLRQIEIRKPYSKVVSFCCSGFLNVSGNCTKGKNDIKKFKPAQSRCIVKRFNSSLFNASLYFLIHHFINLFHSFNYEKTECSKSFIHVDDRPMPA